METIFTQLEVVRQSGVTNMLDFNGVLNAANDQNQHDLADWLYDHTYREYGHLVMVDFSDWKQHQK